MIEGENPKHIPDGEIMIRSSDYPDLVSGLQLTLANYSQVGPGSQGPGEASGKGPIVHPDSKPPARDPRLGNLENSRPDLPTLADQRIVHIDPFRREVFAKFAGCQRSTELLFPPACVFHRVCVNRFIGSTVCLAICLIVSIEIYTSSRDRTQRR
jgi:hypothetical protein